MPYRDDISGFEIYDFFLERIFYIIFYGISMKPIKKWDIELSIFPSDTRAWWGTRVIFINVKLTYITINLVTWILGLF